MLRTFSKGGVHPEENKLSATKSVQVLELPSICTVPVSQHIGAPAKILVKRGDEVKTGQLIAESSSFVSANIHSPVTGKVTKIDNVLDSSGFKKQAVLIQVSEDEWVDSVDLTTDYVGDCNLSGQEIIRKIEEAGIVGLGGATFPTHIKLKPPKDFTAEILIINGVECEPYLTADHRLMLEKGKEILCGTSLLMKGLNVSKAAIGIENNKKDAIEHLSQLAKEFTGIEIVPLKVKYPQGGEKQLIKAVIKREVPSGKLPIHVGCVVQNVGTVYAVYEALQKNKPLIERIITVTGKKVEKPSNFLVRLGTPVENLIRAAGGVPENTKKIISGGPMMGKAINDLSVPVTKGTSGILLIDKNEAHRKPYQDCIRCTKCVNVCPMGLEPYLLMTLSEKEMWEEEEKEQVMDCIECGSCSFSCPANRPLLDYIRYGKNKVGNIIRSRKN